MKNNLQFTVTVSVILIFIGITLIATNYLSQKRDEVFSSINLSLLENKEESTDINIEDISESDDLIPEESPSVPNNNSSDNSNNETYEYYLAKLEIPKIGLSRGFYDKSSSLNRLSINIKMLKESSYPDENNGNVILAAHSGNYYNSYFGNLWKLELGDEAYLYYNNVKYTYKITNIYTDAKDGDVIVKRNPNVSTLTLITCTKDDESTQTIYILERI